MPVPAGQKMVEMLRMEAGEPLAYAQLANSNIYIKYSHYISGRLACLLIHILSPLSQDRSLPEPGLGSNDALRCPYEMPI